MGQLRKNCTVRCSIRYLEAWANFFTATSNLKKVYPYVLFLMKWKSRIVLHCQMGVRKPPKMLRVGHVPVMFFNFIIWITANIFPAQKWPVEAMLPVGKPFGWNHLALSIESYIDCMVVFLHVLENQFCILHSFVCPHSYWHDPLGKELMRAIVHCPFALWMDSCIWGK